MHSARKIFLELGNFRMALFSSAYFASYLGMYIQSFFGWSGPNKLGWWTMIAISVAFLKVADLEKSKYVLLNQYNVT